MYQLIKLHIQNDSKTTFDSQSLVDKNLNAICMEVFKLNSELKNIIFTGLDFLNLDNFFIL